MQKRSARRDFGLTWRSRLAEARARANAPGSQLSRQQIASLQKAVATLDVSSPQDKALFWSGRDILTGEPIDEATPDGPKWWDKLSCHEAEIFGALGIACRLEDTPGGQFLMDLRLNYRDNDPLLETVKDLWSTLSRRFACAATGRVEIIAEGAFDDSVLRTVELEALLSNTKITSINGLDREHFPSNAALAFGLLRRWDVERSRRYSEFMALDGDSTSYERATAHDDFREVQLWYEQDFFDDLGPNRELPALPKNVTAALDRSKAPGAWKYSNEWRELIRQMEANVP